jgi:hypothetical protein
VFEEDHFVDELKDLKIIAVLMNCFFELVLKVKSRKLSSIGRKCEISDSNSERRNAKSAD